jgi:hypothetical protein
VWVLDLVITAFGLASVRMVVSNIVVVKKKESYRNLCLFPVSFFYLHQLQNYSRKLMSQLDGLHCFQIDKYTSYIHIACHSTSYCRC